jgi:hypothetical protein
VTARSKASSVFSSKHFSLVSLKVNSSVCVFLVSWAGVGLSPLGTSATLWPIVPAPDDR